MTELAARQRLQTKEQELASLPQEVKDLLSFIRNCTILPMSAQGAKDYVRVRDEAIRLWRSS